MNFCETSFWNSARTWHTTEPILSSCFTDTVLIWIPSLILWLYLPWSLYDYLNSKRSSISWNAFNISKVIIAHILVIVSVSQLIYTLVRLKDSSYPSDNISLAHIIGNLINFLTLCFLDVIIHLQRASGFNNCGAIWFYLLLKIIFNGLSIPTYLQYDSNKGDMWYQLALYYVGIAIEIILFIIHSFPDQISDSNENGWFGKKTFKYMINDNVDNDYQKRHQSIESKTKLPLNFCPKDMASFPSKLIFYWFYPMIIAGYRDTLTLNNLWQVRMQDQASYLFAQFNRIWRHPKFSIDDNLSSKNHRKTLFSTKNSFNLSDGNNDVINKYDSNGFKSKVDEKIPKVNIAFLLAKQHWRYYTFPCIARFISDILTLTNPLVVKYMIYYFNDYEAPFWHGICYTLFFLANNLLSNITIAYQSRRMENLGLRFRTSILCSIYRKSLVLAENSRKEYTNGEIINLMAVDCERFAILFPYIHYIWTAPAQIIVALMILWGEFEYSTLSALLFIIILIPLNIFIAAKIKKIDGKQLKLKDRRLKATNEMLNGIKVVKLYAMENVFIKKINSIQDQELKYFLQEGLFGVIFNLISACTPFMLSCLSFAVYILIDTNHQLTAAKAFVSITVFNIIRTPLNVAPYLITYLTMTIASIKRLNKFLNCDETTNYVTRIMDKNNAITISNGSFTWNRIVKDDNNCNPNRCENVSSDNSSTRKKDKIPITLSNLNVTIEKGSLVAIVGSVGSGKSSFIYSLLGEMQKLSGNVNISGDLNIAYVPQQAWIQNLTVRDNILFGSTYLRERYNRIIDVCQLKHDLELLPAGDKTEIGEKGINLSGGQKQRISIARACYSDSDLYLFDDPLSAVDSKIGNHIFEQVLSTKNGILREKTRVLVTNAIHFLPYVDKIIILKNGIIEAAGTYEDLLANNSIFHQLVLNYSNTNNDTDDEDDEEYIDKKFNDEPTMETKLSNGSSLKRRKSNLNKNRQLVSAKNSKLVAEEHVETGLVDCSVYKKLFTSMSFTWTFWIFAANFIIIAINTGSNYWLAHWTSSNSHETRYYLLIYSILSLMQVIFVCVGWLSSVFGVLRACKYLQSSLLRSIICSPMHFFDQTPMGRILNRFSTDIDILDIRLLYLIRLILYNGFLVIATVIVISTPTPLFFGISIPFFILYYFIQRFFVSTSRQLKRLISVTRSPIFTHFSETINGTTTIKAYSACERFIDEFDNRVDVNQQCLFPNCIANSWMLVNLEIISNCLIFLTCLLALFSKKYSSNEPGLDGSQIGLSLSYALNLVNSMNVVVRNFITFESNIVSIERITEYINLPSEAAWTSKDDLIISENWPESGNICFENYGTRYRPGLDLALNNINIIIKNQEKIGVVGRSGAGKSSLSLALFRLIEAANGRIYIDGVDISKLGLQTLRSRITIIPQDPILFFGTFRFNLDPFEKKSDEQLWNVLELVNMKQYVVNLQQGLDHVITDGGGNLSLGQRQLICLARALLRKTNILILDEATASVDFETDILIQQTIRTHFANCTVITIAHRLNTILDSDRVLVIDSGKVAEFNSPKTLIEDRKSLFHFMAKDSGIV